MLGKNTTPIVLTLTVLTLVGTAAWLWFSIPDEVPYWREFTFEQAMGNVERNPRDVSALAVAAIHLEIRGRNWEGIKHLQRAVQVDPKDFELRRELAEALARAGRVPEARAQYQEVVRLAPRGAWTAQEARRWLASN